jgi:hypothetical protein
MKEPMKRTAGIPGHTATCQDMFAIPVSLFIAIYLRYKFHVNTL